MKLDQQENDLCVHKIKTVITREDITKESHSKGLTFIVQGRIS